VFPRLAAMLIVGSGLGLGLKEVLFLTGLSGLFFDN
jgi:hypothetical protein